MSEEILELITEATSKGDYKNIGRMVRKARRIGLNNEEIIKSLSAGLTDVSKKYKTKGMYLDDIIKAAGAFEVGIQSLGIPEISKEKKPEERIVLGVMGGPWTIGTKIVAANLKAHGFEVIDAGSDISPKEIA
ncbi:MAG: B12-binding domain-containing protein, partial [Promethearchaeota archaeon]